MTAGTGAGGYFAWQYRAKASKSTDDLAVKRADVRIVGARRRILQRPARR